MLINQTAEKMRTMKLPALSTEFLRQTETPALSELAFDERVGMMVDAEWFSREANRIKKLKKAAKLRIADATFADIDYRPSRKIDKTYIARLSDFAWVRENKNLILTGATGTGKTWLSCAFGAEACRMGLRVLFFRMSILLNELTLAMSSGNLTKFLDKLQRADILIIDDWGLSRLNTNEGRLMLEVFEGRFKECSTIISAQLPVNKWHELFDDATVADAVLDRLVHNSYRFELYGESLRRLAANKDAAGIKPADMPQDYKETPTLTPDGGEDAPQSADNPLAPTA